MNAATLLHPAEPDYITITGTVTERPQVRYRFDERQRCHVPVLCLRLRVAGGGPIVTVQQQFPPQQERGAHCAAKRYRTGRTVTVSTQLHDMQLSVPNASHIRVQRGHGVATGKRHG